MYHDIKTRRDRITPRVPRSLTRRQLNILLIIVAGFFIASLYNPVQARESITVEQYHEQSLQYLEDIRNSNDDIIKLLENK